MDGDRFTMFNIINISGFGIRGSNVFEFISIIIQEDNNKLNVYLLGYNINDLRLDIPQPLKTVFPPTHSRNPNNLPQTEIVTNPKLVDKVNSIKNMVESNPDIPTTLELVPASEVQLLQGQIQEYIRITNQNNRTFRRGVG